MFGANVAGQASGAIDDEELRALNRLYALATAEAERSFPLDADARRRLANMVVFTYRSAAADEAASEAERERYLLEESLKRFAPLQRAVLRAMRGRRW